MRFFELKARWCGRKVSWLFRALRDPRGVSAVEFALIAPLLIGLYVGAIELGNALTINRRTSAVASTAADLAAQVKTVTAADLKDIVAASSSILTPYPATSPFPLKIVLTSVVADDKNATKVDWSYASNGGTARACKSAVTLPAGLTQANSSVIMAEVTYAFTPLLNLSFANPGSFNMSRTFYARPRKSLTVQMTN